VYTAFAITFHLDGLQVAPKDGEARDMKTISYSALIQTDTQKYISIGLGILVESIQTVKTTFRALRNSKFLCFNFEK